ncbi:beta-galactosidase [Paenibacillus sp. 598K]|uniref:beta-galactosidase n=1 Tax=Paenibacillus sp. 598K TaxID=1117987 RepID=UPI000FF9A6CE|nr:beta-galactosidase [Paenibacillus sp. 598K]GBF71810.1 beta-galactosidase [Paenibacillus sp. 598K]
MWKVNPPYIGAAYYPEGLGQERIAYDLAQMKQTGINTIRLAEFAWSRLEPEEGHYDFHWLRTVVEQLAEQGIGTILCTPSATPPFWLTDKHPEILPMRYNGHRTTHGARLHYCPNNLVYRQYISRINTALAQEFADCESVLGWQVDNEAYLPFGEGCFCPDCERGFRHFLQERFTDIADLNEAWQLTLWSQEYPSFAQVLMPRPDTPHHPSLKTAWLEFQEQSTIAYIDEQITALKRHTRKPVSTDMMPLPFIDHVKANRQADLVMFNHYCNEEGMHHVLFWLDYLKTVKDTPLWNTETDPNGNGGTTLMGYKPQGFCTANSWLPMAFGGEANLYWHWRGHRAGHELMHGSVIDSAGRPTYTQLEISRIAQDLSRCARFLNGTKLKQARIAIHYSAYAEKLFAHQGICEHPGYWHVLFKHFYMPLIEAGIRVDIISPDHDLTPYACVISPLLACLDEYDLRERLEQWIEQGGRWIAGPLTDVRNRHAAKFAEPFGSLEQWGGIRLKYFAAANAAYPFPIQDQEGTALESQLWYDGFELEGASAYAVYGENAHEFAGLAAMTVNNKGAGKITVLGTVPEEAVYIQLVRSYMREPAQSGAGINASPNVLCMPRSGPAGEGSIVIEYRNRPGWLTIDAPAVNLLTGATLQGKVEVPAFAVMVLHNLA